MNIKRVYDYLYHTPGADSEDVMFVFPEMTLKEAANAIQRQKLSKMLRWWLLITDMFARLFQERYRQKT